MGTKKITIKQAFLGKKQEERYKTLKETYYKRGSGSREHKKKQWAKIAKCTDSKTWEQWWIPANKSFKFGYLGYSEMKIMAELCDEVTKELKKNKN